MKIFTKNDQGLWVESEGSWVTGTLGSVTNVLTGDPLSRVQGLILAGVSFCAGVVVDKLFFKDKFQSIERLANRQSNDDVTL